MTKHAFLEGMGLGVVAGAAIGIAVASRSGYGHDMRRMARKAARRMDAISSSVIPSL